MPYDTIKEAAVGLTKLALNGSPYWRLAVTSCILGLCAFSVWGYYAYAHASEVDKKIAAAIGPVQQQVADLTEDTKEIVVELLASKIRDAAEARCKAAPGDRERDNREIEALQRKYVKREGQRYDVPECDEL
jgi:hypothetical protein